MARVGAALLITALILCFSLPVLGAGPSIRFDPLLVERVIQPGRPLEYAISVDNADRFNPVVVDVYVADIEEDVNGTYHLRDAGTTAYSASPYVSLSTERLYIPAGSTRTIAVSVQVPRGISGGLYGAVVLSISGGEPSPGQDTLGGTQFVFVSASFLELVIADTAVRREAYVDSFTLGRSADVPHLISQVGLDAVVFSMVVANHSNTHISARGELIIRTSEGATVDRFPLGGGRGVILPGASVALRSVLSRNYPPGDYTARAIVIYGGHRPLVSEMSFTIAADEFMVSEAVIESSEISRLFIDPPELDLAVRPGAFASAILEISNRGAEPISVDGLVLPLVFDLYGDFLPEIERGAAPDWIEMMPSSFVLDPGRSRRVRISLRPPREAVGGHYADILFRSGDGGLHTETGASLFAFVGSDMQRLAHVEIAHVEQSGASLQLDLRLTNSGTVHLHPAAELVLNQHFPPEELEGGRIIGARSERLASVSIPPGGNPVLPGTERAFSFLVPTDLDPGDYEVLVRIDYGGEEPTITGIRFDIERDGSNESI